MDTPWWALFLMGWGAASLGMFAFDVVLTIIQSIRTQRRIRASLTRS